MDGLGEEQVSWVVSGNGKRILHFGDTLWHGYWWAIAEHGPFDVAFLPINGAMVLYPSKTGIPASLTPEHAAAAAERSQAPRSRRRSTTVPFDCPPAYAEHPDAEAAFLRSTQRQTSKPLRPSAVQDHSSERGRLGFEPRGPSRDKRSSSS
ncbi:MAG: MBL fold metallo-hydrolase [Actinomycetota bacterium]